MLSYDTAAIALSFVPAAGERLSSTSSSTRTTQNANGVDLDPANATEAKIVRDDSYTYHHLRRSLYDLCTEAGVEVASRYTVPSAHLTIARFVSQEDISVQQNGNVRKEQEVETTVNMDNEKVKRLIDKIEEVNAWLQDKFWPKGGGEEEVIDNGGEWIVGEEKGLDCRKGTLWYGGGETIRLGNGFAR
ncbi:hypothetical protein G7Y79_00025g057630 [Physcia stellaris]|nr:hypothetical protein G7Y79_00025g057630 [Physcia stellaris]